MAAIAVSAVRQRVAAIVEALVLPAPWTQSRWPYDLFPIAEPGQYAHLAFAVGVPRTSIPLIEGSRKRLTEGANVETTLGIRWTHRVKVNTAPADLDAALDAEAVLVKALFTTSLVDLHLFLTGLDRKIVGDGTWVLVDVTLQARHQLALS